MKNNLKKMIAAVVVASMSLTFVACGSNKTTDSSKKAQTSSSEKKNYSKTLRLSTTANTSNFITLADGQGYFKNDGVPVKFENIESPSEALNAILLNKLDINTIALIPTLNFIAQGTDFTIFGGYRSEGGEIITSKANSSNYKDITSLKGKKIAVIHLDTGDYNLRKLLREKGIDPSKDIKYQEVDSYTSVVEAVKKGTVDYGIAISEIARLAEQQGLSSVQKISDLVPDYVCCRQVALTSSIKENRQEYVDLLKSEIKGYKYMEENQDASAQYLSGITGQPVAFHKQTLYSKTAPLFNPEPSKKQVIDFFNILKEEGVLKTDVDITKHIDTSLFKDAITDLLKESPKDATYKALYKQFQANN